MCATAPSRHRVPRGATLASHLPSIPAALYSRRVVRNAKLAVAAPLLYVMSACRQAIASPNVQFGQFFSIFFSVGSAEQLEHIP
jgi:hypothetical protein